MATVVFDLDGTLADTSGDLLAAANAVFRQWGHGDVLNHSTSIDRSTAMKGGRAMLRLGLDRLHGEVDEARVDAGYQPLLDAYGMSIAEQTYLFPGAAEAVDRLLAAGHQTAVCTNKPEALAQTLLSELGVRGLFGSLIGADTLPVRKPDPAPLRAAVAAAGGTMDGAVLIGDTVTDRATARNAGVPCVLVTFGPDGHGVADLAPEGMLDHYDGLEESLSRVGIL